MPKDADLRYSITYFINIEIYIIQNLWKRNYNRTKSKEIA